MAIAFSRSLQSLDKDHSNSNIALVILFGVAILSWLYWFAFGTVTLYANAQKFTLQKGGMLTAQFAEVDQQKLKPGQRGAISFEPITQDGASSYEIEITNVPNGRDSLIEIYVFGDTSVLEQQNAKISIAVGKIRPLELVWNMQQR